MVPWHLQPRYTSGHVKETPDERAARMRAKKQEKRQRRKRQKEAVGENRGGNDGDLARLGLAEARMELGQCEGGREPRFVPGSGLATVLQEKASGVWRSSSKREELKMVREKSEPRKIEDELRTEQTKPRKTEEASKLGTVQESSDSEPGKTEEASELGSVRESSEPGKMEAEQRTEPRNEASKLQTVQESSESRKVDAGTLSESGVGYTTYQRYYHVFREGELVDLVHRVSALRVQEEFYDHENWCVLATKVE